MDISKVFDRVWHDGLIYEVKCIGINDMFLKLITHILENRFQRVVLNGQTSSWEPVLAGVPLGSVLGPLFFLIYINELSKNLSSNTKLFADDTPELNSELTKNYVGKILQLQFLSTTAKGNFRRQNFAIVTISLNSKSNYLAFVLDKK